MHWKALTTSVAFVVAFVAVATGIGVAATGTASASPTVCVTGPFGHVTVCNPAPDRGDWYQDRPRWRDRWNDRGHWH